MLPLLKHTSGKKEHSIKWTIESLVELFKLREEESKEVSPSGQQYSFDNYVDWARTHLKKPGLFESTRRSFFRITDLGLDVLSKSPKEINVKFLEKFLQFIKFRHLRREKIEEEQKEESEQTPQE